MELILWLVGYLLMGVAATVCCLLYDKYCDWHFATANIFFWPLLLIVFVIFGPILLIKKFFRNYINKKRKERGFPEV